MISKNYRLSKPENLRRTIIFCIEEFESQNTPLTSEDRHQLAELRNTTRDNGWRHITWRIDRLMAATDTY